VACVARTLSRARPRAAVASGFALLLLVLFLLTGCPPQKPPTIDRTVDLPDYATLRAKYNARLEHLDQLWASAVVAMEWKEGEKDRFEQGEGHFIALLPGKFYLTAGKFDPLIHLGSDGERFWLFDLQGDKTVHVGRYENTGKPCSESLGLPVDPQDLPKLMALLPLPELAVPPKVKPATEGRVAIEMPVDARGNVLHIELDPGTGEATQMHVVDAEGLPIVVVRLSQYTAVETDGKPPGAWPRVPSRVVFTLPDEQGEMRITLSRMMDAKRQNRIKPQVFDFEFLKNELYKPANVVNLDAGCE
jgi:hypothetical protein